MDTISRERENCFPLSKTLASGLHTSTNYSVVNKTTVDFFINSSSTNMITMEMVHRNLTLAFRAMDDKHISNEFP